MAGDAGGWPGKGSAGARLIFGLLAVFWRHLLLALAGRPLAGSAI
jgi:hypothetical protein